MNEKVRKLTDQYSSALGEYVNEPSESALKMAYDLGRQAIAQSIGVLQMAAIYQRSLFAALRRCSDPVEFAAVIERATAFFAESVSSFEMALRGFQAAHDTLEVERQRYHEQFEFAPDAYLVTDAAGTVCEANQAASRLFHSTETPLFRKPLLAFVAASHRTGFCEQLARLERGDVDRLEEWVTELEPPGGNSFPSSLTVAAIRGPDGEVSGMRWLVRDISERLRIEREREMHLLMGQVVRAESEANQRLAFLAEASTLLAASLDYETALKNVANQSVPFLCDWCFIHIEEDNGAVRCVAAAHAASSHFPEVDDAPHPSYLVNPDGVEGASLIRRTGKAEIISRVSPRWIASIAATEEQRVLFSRLEFKSALVVPMIARSRTIGTLAIVSTAAGRSYGASDLALCEDLARRCAFAAENARLYHQVIVERDRAEKANRAKDEFLAVLSHELRNPLMPVMGWVRILKDQSALRSDKFLNEGILALERNAQNIHRLVEDCLDLARISERKIRLEPQIIDANEIATACVGAVADSVRAKGLLVKLNLSPSAIWISADRTRMEQVVVNLMTNAIRYTPQGGSVTIETRMADDEMELKVQDTGLGIAPDFIHQIFEPFRQGTNAWLSSESGLGIGLSIARQIVQIHRGRIWASSKGLGHGSTFVVRLPVSSGLGAHSALGREEPRAAIDTPLRVLLVDDSEDILFLTQMELEWLGYSVRVARDGTTGLQMAEREIPDALVSDIKLPGIDGYELIECIRRNPALKSIGAIALTGFGMKDDIQRALAAGYDAHMVKPADIKKMSELLQKVVSLRKDDQDSRSIAS
jgi:PAS domain S-box-containing protein